LADARRAQQQNDLARAWRHLERAHVLNQADAWPHLRVQALREGPLTRLRPVLLATVVIGGSLSSTLLTLHALVEPWAERRGR
jgi:hypothetical protein